MACGDAATLPHAERVLSLSPFATDVVVALGAADQLVGVDAESAALAGVPNVPVATLETLADFAPTIVMLPPDSAPGPQDVGTFRSVSLHAHDLGGLAQLHLEIGSALGLAREARALASERTRPLAELSAGSRGQRRPLAAGLLGVEPLVVAGDHSFATDLLEVAGAESVTHGIDTPTLEWSRERLRAEAPEFIVRFSASPLDPEERQRTLAAVEKVGPVLFIVLPGDPPSLEAALAAAKVLRKAVAARSESTMERSGAGEAENRDR